MHYTKSQVLSPSLGHLFTKAWLHQLGQCYGIFWCWALEDISTLSSSIASQLPATSARRLQPIPSWPCLQLPAHTGASIPCLPRLSRTLCSCTFSHTQHQGFPQEPSGYPDVPLKEINTHVQPKYSLGSKHMVRYFLLPTLRRHVLYALLNPWYSPW